MPEIGGLSLDSQDASLSTIAADVCVIGAGAAGIFIARLLARKGVNVVMLEARPAKAIDPSEIGFVPEFSSAVYAATTNGRSFGVGGTTSRWGGLLAPHSEADHKDGVPAANAETWRHIVDVVNAEARTVLGELGAPPGLSFSDQSIEGRRPGGAVGAFQVQRSVYLPFRKKNFSWLLDETRRSSPTLRLYHGAVAKDWLFSGERSAAKVAGVTAVSAAGKAVTVTARKFVIAAGAVETSRILLEIRSAAGALGGGMSNSTGQFLSDHLSVAVADVDHRDAEAVARTYGPRFKSGWMQGWRIVEAHSPPASPRAFLHFIFDQQNPGFSLAKEILVASQAGRRPSISLGLLLNGVMGLAQLGVSRYLQSRLHIPSETPTRLQLDVEQDQAQDNRILLTENRDRWGRLVPQINWSITSVDYRNIELTSERLLSKWVGDQSLPRLRPRALDLSVAKPFDAYHPVGTCRMGTDASAVVNHDLRVIGLENAWVLSTAVLPSAGSANPTFTMLCMASQLATRIQEALQAG